MIAVVFILQLLFILSVSADNAITFADTASSVTLVDGEYYIQNRFRPRYVQVDDNDKPGYSTSGSILEQWNFCGDAHQRWMITSVGDGYYKIVNVKSDKAISVPANKIGSEDVALVQEPYAGLDRQKWKITWTKYGSFKIKAKSAEAITNKDLAMVIGDSLLGDSDGLNVEQRKYVDNNSFRDEWNLHFVMSDTGTAVEGQKKDNWCWVATSRMFAKHYFPNVTYTQNQAVVDIYGSEVDVKAGLQESASAMNFYISNLTSNVFNIRGTGWEYGVYSEQTVRTFLYNNHVLFIGLGLYNSDNVNTRQNGHVILIYGYTKQTIIDDNGAVNTKYWFLVRDPWPKNQGKSYMISYEKLYNGRNPQIFEEADKYVWECQIVINTSYSSNLVPGHFTYNE